MYHMLATLSEPDVLLLLAAGVVAARWLRHLALARARR